LTSGTTLSLNVYSTYTLISGGPVGTDNANSYVQLTRLG
jgi:hypothetical protein